MTNTLGVAKISMFVNEFLIPPTRRQRFIGALQSASSNALDEIPYAPVLKVLVDGWNHPLD